MHNVIELLCPGCGARVTTGQKECEYCHSPIVISTFNSVYSMPITDVNKYASTYRDVLSKHPESDELNSSIAMCYLKLKLYDKALLSFEKAIESNFDNSETYFYAAISLLKGKRAFLQQRSTIQKIEEYIDAALAIELKGIYYYFRAYIKYDFHELKGFRKSPDCWEDIETAFEVGVSEYDIEQLFGILGVEVPNQFENFNK